MFRFIVRLSLVVAVVVSSGSHRIVGRASRSAGLHVPLTFAANDGQTDPQVKFIGHGRDYTLFLTEHDAVLAHGSDAIRLGFTGASGQARIVPADRQPGGFNYLIGSDRSRWRRAVATYAKVRYEELYPGVDLVFYGNDRQLEYDLIVKPGADTRQIRLAVSGAKELTADTAGDLIARADTGEIRLRRPTVYQASRSDPHARVTIDGRYRVADDHTVTFDIGHYDRTRPLVIDPVVVYATYLSGDATDDMGAAQHIAVDASGAAYVTGYTDSSDFPTTAGARQPLHIVTFSGTDGHVPCTAPRVTPKYIGGYAFVAKLSPDGSSLEYGTYLGGTYSIDQRAQTCGGPVNVGTGIAVDAAGSAYVTGATESADFPTTSGPVDSSMFVVKLDPTGSNVVYSTRVASSINATQSSAIAVGADGSAYVTGRTMDPTFPAVPGAFQPECHGCYAGFLTQGFDAFVFKLDPFGSFIRATFLGGLGTQRGAGIAVNAAGEVSVIGSTLSTVFPVTANAVRPNPGGDAGLLGGSDVFVTKLSADFSTLIFSTYLNGDHADTPGGVAVDAAGNTYAAGSTRSPEFPTTADAYLPVMPSSPIPNDVHAFVSKFTADGTLTYSTFLGGHGEDQGFGVGADGTGRAYVVGLTSGSGFPLTADAIQTTTRPEWASTFLSVFNASGTELAFSTLLGGPSNATPHGVAVGPDGSAYIAGSISDFVDGTGAPCCRLPTTAHAFQQDVDAAQAHGGPGDVFVMRVTVGPPPLVFSALARGNLWLGLKNSDDVGTKCDLQIELLKNGSVVTRGELDNVPGGSSGFNNAVLRQVGAALGSAVAYGPGDTLGVRVSVRVAASSGHRSGTARLWYGDPGANTRIETTVNGLLRVFYLTTGFALGPAAGPGPRSTADVLVDRAVGGNPFKPFGTWSITF